MDIDQLNQVRNEVFGSLDMCQSIQVDKQVLESVEEDKRQAVQPQFHLDILFVAALDTCIHRLSRRSSAKHQHLRQRALQKVQANSEKKTRRKIHKIHNFDLRNCYLIGFVHKIMPLNENINNFEYMLQYFVRQSRREIGIKNVHLIL